MVDDTKRLDGNGLARVWTATQKLVADNINDGVPVNGVVEFDGLEADIPDGYTKIGTRDSRLLIKKGEKTIPVRSTVVNEETASDTDVYSCEYINDKLEDIENTFSGTIPQGDIVVDSIRSKNMFDGVLLNGVYNDNTGEFTPSVSLCSKKIKAKNNTTYYLSGITGNVRVHYWNNNTYVGNEVITAPNSFVSQGNITAFQFGGNTPHSNIQLEEGSTATTYTPYQELNPDNFKNKEIVVGNIKSKNMLDVRGIEQKTDNGVTCTYDSSTNIITLHGTVTSNTQANFYIPSAVGMKLKRLTKYTTSIFYISGTVSGGNLKFFAQDKNHNYAGIQLEFDGSNVNSTLQFDDNLIVTSGYCLIRAYSGQVLDNLKIKIQIEENPTTTDYMPYQDLENKELYTTGEIVIGTWINGKPLYRKVIDLENSVSINAGDWASSSKTLPNCKIIINSYACKEADATSQIRATIGTNDTIMIMNPANFNISIRYIIVEYTKTTD